MIIATHEETLRRLVLHDERCIQSTLGIHLNNEAAGLDPKIQALVRLGGLVAMGAAPGSYHWAAEAETLRDRTSPQTSDVCEPVRWDDSLDSHFHLPTRAPAGTDGVRPNPAAAATASPQDSRIIRNHEVIGGVLTGLVPVVAVDGIG